MASKKTAAALGQVFFILNRPQPGSITDEYSGTEFLNLDTSKLGAAPTCPRCGRFIGLLKWLPPYEADLECWGKEFGDLAFGPGEDFLVSERFARLFKQSGLTSLEGFEPVRVRRAIRRKGAKRDPPQYLHVTVVRSRAAIDRERSGFVWQIRSGSQDCDECRSMDTKKRHERIVIEPGTWEGEDIFVPRGLFCYVTSQRFKNFCDEHQIRNAVLIPANTYWHDSYPYENKQKVEELLSQPVGGPILEKIKQNGDVYRYDTRTNHLLIAAPDGRAKALLQPVDGRDYWEEL